MAKQLTENIEGNKAQRTDNPKCLRVVPVKEEFICQRLLPMKEAALYLGRGLDSTREMVYAGVFPVIQVGDHSKIWIDIRDLDSWIDENKKYMYAAAEAT